MKYLKITCLFIPIIFCFSFITANAQSDADDYLVAHYKFDGNIEDAQGLYHGEFIAGVGPMTEPQYMEGYDETPNGAILFTGNPDSCYMIRVGTFNPAAEGEVNEQTIAFWGYWNGSTGESQDIINKRSSWSDAGMMWGINQHAGTGHVISVRMPGQQSGDSDSEKGMPLQKWTHVAVTLDGTNVHFYMDGECYDTLPYTYGSGVDANINMGSAQNTDGSIRSQDLYNGALDDVRFYSRMLTADEVNILYQGVSGIDDRSSTVPALSQNYPNPFNTSTTIKYSLTGNTQTEIVVCDILGHKVATLVNQYQRAGNYDVIWDASKANAGVYFYRMKADNFVVTKKMMLVK
jgi:hypothetical protein